MIITELCTNNMILVIKYNFNSFVTTTYVKRKRESSNKVVAQMKLLIQSFFSDGIAQGLVEKKCFFFFYNDLTTKSSHRENLRNLRFFY